MAPPDRLRAMVVAAELGRRIVLVVRWNPEPERDTRTGGTGGGNPADFDFVAYYGSLRNTGW